MKGPIPSPVAPTPNKKRFFWPVVVLAIILAIVDVAFLLRLVPYTHSLFSTLRFSYIFIQLFAVVAFICAYWQMKSHRIDYTWLLFVIALELFFLPGIIDGYTSIGILH